VSIYALTPTGMRPEGLALLGEYLNEQTYDGPLTWIVVDDCDPGSRIPRMREGIDPLAVRPGWRWKPGQNTQAACMREGLKKVPDSATLLILEDDDVYLPEYIETMLGALADYELIGERISRYYNIQTSKFRVLPGKVHASLAATVCCGSALALLKTLCATDVRKPIDFALWRSFQGRKKLLDTQNVVGIKGLPGRPGIGVGHRRHFGSPDNSDTLRMWAGNYADNYERLRGIG